MYGHKEKKDFGQVLQNLNVWANNTRALKSWSFNYFEEYIMPYVIFEKKTAKFEIIVCCKL